MTQEDDGALLGPADLARCERADRPGGDRLPIPTRMVSNGEYLPYPQTAKQRMVERLVRNLAERSVGRGDARRVLAGLGGLAAGMVAINQVFGASFFDVTQQEIGDAGAAADRSTPSDVFVFDDQLHTVRSSLHAVEVRHGADAGRAIAQGPSVTGFDANPFNPDEHLDELGGTWSPWSETLVGLPLTDETFHLVQFIKDVFLDSQVNVGLLSNVTAGDLPIPGVATRPPPRNVVESLQMCMLTAAQTVAVRDFINEIAGSTRMLAHGLFYPGVGNLDYMAQQIEQYVPDSWKGYNVKLSAKVDDDPESLLRQWRMDDEKVVYPTYDLISQYADRAPERPGLRNICVHKGLAPPGPATPEIGHPCDIPQAAKDWPGLNFIIYHACIRPNFFVFDSFEEIKSGTLREGVPDISWTTEFVQLCQDLPNVYADLGTTWASMVITFPTVAAHLIGQLLKYLGEDRVVFGSDSVWYGSPQWQIESFWRFQIPEELQRRYGYPPLTEQAKRKILGLNSAGLYGLDPSPPIGAGSVYQPVPADYETRMPDELKAMMEFPDFDHIDAARDHYRSSGVSPSHTRYGWVRRDTGG